MPTEIVSPANHFCLKFLIFHSSDGMMPRDFVRKIDAGLLSQAEVGRIFGDAFDAELFGERIEEDITGLIDSLFQIHSAVSACDPAPEATSIEIRADQHSSHAGSARCLPAILQQT